MVYCCGGTGKLLLEKCCYLYILSTTFSSHTFYFFLSIIFYFLSHNLFYFFLSFLTEKGKNIRNFKEKCVRKNKNRLGKNYEEQGRNDNDKSKIKVKIMREKYNYEFLLIMREKRNN